MLRNTFVHIPGIGKTTESRLWAEGCLCWDDLLREPERWSLGTASRAMAERHVERSIQALDRKEHRFFRDGLGSAQAWRAFADFRDRCVYLDIETDGGYSGESVTAIGLYDGSSFRCLLKGRDLESFRDLISPYGMIVTFFGGSFDLPMLQRRFPGLRFDQIHLDLCPTLRRLGHRGGLKKIEKQLGISRSAETDGLNGYDAVVLWRRYERHGDRRALDRLVAYNREDVVNLERLAELAYEGLGRELRGSLGRAGERATQGERSLEAAASLASLERALRSLAESNALQHQDRTLGQTATLLAERGLLGAAELEEIKRVFSSLSKAAQGSLEAEQEAASRASAARLCQALGKGVAATSR